MTASAKPDVFKLSARCAQWAYIQDNEEIAYTHFKFAKITLEDTSIDYQAGFAEGLTRSGSYFTKVTFKEYAKKLYKDVKCKTLLPI